MELTRSADDELLSGVQEPRIRVAPAATSNDATDVIDMCACYGLELDEWQQIALESALGLDADGTWSSDTAAICCPRQSGKGCLIEARTLAGVLLFGEKTIACSAHETRTTRLSFERLLGYFENYHDLSKRVKSVQRWVGREQIRLKDGSLIVFPARSRGALRGYTIDALVLDEAQYLTNAQYEAVLPTLAARPNTQTWHLGTVPTHIGDGEVFCRLRAAALAGNSERLCWLEWSAEPGTNLDDREQWAQANPALGKRISLEAIAAERRELSDDGFARERLGLLWPTDRAARVINPLIWAGLAGAGPADGTPPSALAIDSSPGRELAIAGAWRLEDGRVHVELLAADVSDPLNALQWVVERAGKRIPVVIDGASPAASMVPLLLTQKCTVIVTSAGDMGRACGGFLDDVVTGRLSHIDQAQLGAAVAGAAKRPIGAAGAFGWDRRDGSVFVAPLVAVTLARHGAITAPPPRTGRACFV